MLGNLKKRLFSPIRPVSTTERSRRRSSCEGVSTIEDHGRNRRRSDATFNLDAGATLLHKYQSDWSRLHDLSEENAKGAERVDVAVDRLVRSCEQRREVVTVLVLQLASLPALKDAVRQLAARLGALESGFADVERLLLAFEDTVEVQRQQEKQLEERFQLALYKERKAAQLEVFKEKLVAEREVRLCAMEAQRRSLLRERQETFGEAFEEEMQHYKQHGRVERVYVRGGSVEEGQYEHRLKLEDVELEQDDGDNALDSFLATEATEDMFTQQDGEQSFNQADDESNNESSPTEPE